MIVFNVDVSASRANVVIVVYVKAIGGGSGKGLVLYVGVTVTKELVDVLAAVNKLVGGGVVSKVNGIAVVLKVIFCNEVLSEMINSNERKDI